MKVEVRLFGKRKGTHEKSMEGEKKGHGGVCMVKAHDIPEWKCLSEVYHYVQWIYTNNINKSHLNKIPIKSKHNYENGKFYVLYIVHHNITIWLYNTVLDDLKVKAGPGGAVHSLVI